MLDPVSLFREGGPIMYLVLLVGLALPPAALVALGLQAAKVRVPALVWAVVGAAPFLAGVLGTFLGFSMVLQAIEQVSPEMLTKLSANGLSVGLYTLIAGSSLSAFGFAGFAGALGLGALIGVGEERRWSVGGGAALGGLLFAFGLLILGRFIGAFVTGMASLGLAMAGVADSAADEHAKRLVAARGAVGAFGVTAVLASVVADLCMVAAMASQAFANAPAEMVTRLMYRAMEGVWMATGVGVTAALVLGLVTVGLLAFRIPLWNNPRTLGSGALATLALLGMFGSLLLVAPQAWTIADHSTPPASKRAPVLEARGIELPSLDLELHRSMLPGRYLTITRDQATVDDGPASPQDLQNDRYVTIEAASGTPIGTLRPWAEALVGAEVDFAVRGQGELMVLQIPVGNGKPPPPRGADDGIPDRFAALLIEEERPDEERESGRFEGVWTRSGWALGRYANGRRQGFGTVGEAELGERLAALRDLYPADEDLQVWLKDEAQVDDLIGLVATQVKTGGERSSGLRVTWRVDPAPEMPAPEMEPTGDDEDTGEVADGEDADGEEAGVPSGRVTLGEVTLTGSLGRTEMNQVLSRARPVLGQCFAAPGSAVLKLIVGRTGAVQSSLLRQGSGDDAVDVCLVRASQRLRFAPPKGGGIAILAVPLEVH